MSPEEIRRRGTGYIPRPLDVRELKYAQPLPKAERANLKQTVQVAPSPVEDQGRLGSCVGHAVSSAAEILSPQNPQLSRRYVWQMGKRKLGITGNSGIYLATGCDVSLDGICTEESWPYDDQYPDQDAPQDLDMKDPVLSHQLITGDKVAGVWAALNSGHPVVIGIGIDSTSLYQAFQQGGLIDHCNKDPNSWDVWHALYCWKYHNAGLVIVRNSWGMQTNPATTKPDKNMTDGDLAFTLDVFRTVVYEARELSPEKVYVPPPHPTSEVTITNRYWTWGGNDWQIDTYPQKLTIGKDGYLDTLVELPDGSFSQSPFVAVKANVN